MQERPPALAGGLFAAQDKGYCDTAITGPLWRPEEIAVRNLQKDSGCYDAIATTFCGVIEVGVGTAWGRSGRSHPAESQD